MRPRVALFVCAWCVGLIVIGAGAQTHVPAAPADAHVTHVPAPGGPKAVLTQADFTYVGAFRMPERITGLSTDTSWSKGLAHRHVGGRLRLFQIGNNLSHTYEAEAPATLAMDPLLAPRATGVRSWGQIDAGEPSRGLTGLYWDEQDQRLYWSGGDGYNADAARAHAPSFGYVTLDEAAGTATRRGPFAIADRSTKMINCGVIAIPAWFADAYLGGRRLAAGFGGYQSIATIGPVSIGPSLTAFDPRTLTGPADSRIAGQALLGYPFNPLPYSNPQRARRDTDYRNDFDHWNPKDGIGYWSWTDQMGQAGVWIDTPTKSGIVFFPTMGNGRTWYETSTLHAEHASHAWFVYAPTDLAQVATEQRKEWEIQARSFWSVQYPGIRYPMDGWADLPLHAVVGVTYDVTTRRLYVAVRLAIIAGEGPHPATVYVYQVA